DPSPGPVDGSELMTFSLVNAETDEPVAGYENLANTSTINLDGLDVTQFSIVAHINPNHPDAGSVKSVKFNSPFGSQTESVVPYALFGDSSGNFAGKALTEGEVTLEAIAYTQSGVGSGSGVGLGSGSGVGSGVGAGAASSITL
ncbi:MAG: hypothetical protein AAFQ57_18445, partial [Cyanobacteria bacterium J06626_14]